MKGIILTTEDWRFLQDLVKGQKDDLEGLVTPTYIKTAVNNHLTSIQKSLSMAIDTEDYDDAKSS